VARKRGRKAGVSLAEFERRLARIATRADFGAADSDWGGPAGEQLLEELKSDSRVVLATPRGPAVYESAVIDSAWDLVESSALSTPQFGPAADGEDLDNRIHHWLTLIPSLLRGRMARTWDLLGPCTPTRDVPTAGKPLRIGVFGDGGYAGAPQTKVFEMIAKRHAEHAYELVIHLGDTYRGGSEREMFRHLLVPLLSLRDRLGLRAYSLCGNHDIYAGPDGYLGVLSGLSQPGRYFSIESPGWRVACLDTTLADKSLRRSMGALDAEQTQWLQDKQMMDPKRVVVLSHHVPRSGWESPNAALALLATTIPGVVAWYWGHEHRSVAYDPSQVSPVRGGCVGHGVFLEKFRKPKNREGIAWFPKDSRCTCFSKTGTRYWPHGYLELELDDAGIRETWHTENTVPYRRTIAAAL
jgi:hypothetical protein